MFRNASTRMLLNLNYYEYQCIYQQVMCDDESKLFNKIMTHCCIEPMLFLRTIHKFLHNSSAFLVSPSTITATKYQNIFQWEYYMWLNAAYFRRHNIFPSYSSFEIHFTKNDWVHKANNVSIFMYVKIL